MKIFPIVILTASISLPIINYMSEVNAAEEVIIPVLQQGDRNISRPHNSQTKEEVRTQFGDPQNEINAVGVPPISKWEYAKFIVVFEDNLVIHSVLKK